MTEGKHLVTTHPEQHAVQRMHPLVERSLAQNPDPATLRELLMVQREWEQGEAKKAYTRALAALKRDLPTVVARDKLVDFPTSKGRTTYRHTTLGALMDAITEPLTSHGFSLGWEPSRSERGDVVVTCRITHAEGHSETCTLFAPVDTTGSKSPAQGVASTVTLLQRYTAQSLLGIASADMPEPTGEPDEPPEERVDASRNLKALETILRKGRTKAEAEELTGCSVSEWTEGDLAQLRAWLKKKRVREPGEEG